MFPRYAGAEGPEVGGGMVGVGSRRIGIATHDVALLVSGVRIEYSPRSESSLCLSKVLVGFNFLCFAFGGQRHPCHMRFACEKAPRGLTRRCWRSVSCVGLSVMEHRIVLYFF